MFHAPEQYRITDPTINRKLNAFYINEYNYGNNRIFQIPYKKSKSKIFLNVIASDYDGWEHVSVTICNIKRCPTWDEMSFIKDHFWDDDDTVIQFHPPKANYINTHPYCLHLWRVIGREFPLPEMILV